MLDEAVYSHHPSLIFIGLGYEREFLAQTEVKKATFLNGHGGDHLFYANPGTDAVAEALINSRFRHSRIILENLVRYYGTSYSNVALKVARTLGKYLINQSIIPKAIDSNRQYFSSTWASRDFIALADQVTDYKKIFDIAKYSPVIQNKLSNFYQLAQDISHPRLRDGLGRMIFPFFNSDTIAMAFSTAAVESFDGAINRKQIRQAFYQRYRQPQLWRRSKGHTTSVAIYSLNKHQSEIRALLRHGYLVSKGLVKWPKLEQELNKACYGVIGLSPLLMHAVGIEIFLKKAGVC